MNSCLCGLFDGGSYWWILILVLVCFVFNGNGSCGSCGGCGGGCGGGCVCNH